VGATTGFTIWSVPSKSLSRSDLISNGKLMASMDVIVHYVTFYDLSTGKEIFTCRLNTMLGSASTFYYSGDSTN
jgi:hypothetical protein